MSADRLPRARLDYLDTLRGVAALIVFFGHYAGAYGMPQAFPGPVNRVLEVLLGDGFAAVSFFFVLSGLVLSFKPLRAGPGLPGFGYLRFALGRVFRIGVPLAGVFLLSAALIRGLPFAGFDTVPAPSAWFVGAATGAPRFEWAQLLPSWSNFEALLPQTWTLRTELNMSLAMPILILIALKSGWWMAGFCLVAQLKFGSNFFPHFGLGVLLAKHSAWITARLGALSRPARLGLLGLGSALYLYRNTLGPVVGGPSSDAIFTVTGVGAALLLALAMSSPATQALLDRKWGAHLGRVSYSIYLVHFTVLIVLTPRLLGALNAAGLRQTDLVWALGLLGSVACVLALSELTYRFFEKPSIRLARRAQARA